MTKHPTEHRFNITPTGSARLPVAVLFLLCIGLGFDALGAVRTWTGAGGSAAWTTAGNWSGNAVPTDQDDAVIPKGTPGVVEVSGAVTVRSLQNAGTLRLAGVFADNATLQVLADSENTGVIQLGSTRGDRFSKLQSAGTARWLNRSGGRIETVAEAGGSRQFAGRLVNQGLVSAPALRLQVGGGVEVAGGRFEGAVELLNAEVQVTASPSESTELLLFGDATRLISDNLPRVVLRVVSDFGYNATLTVASNSVNHGGIRLESQRNDRTTRMAVAAAVSFENAADGVLEAVGTDGGRETAGAISNRGIVRTSTGRPLRMVNAGTKFAQLSGTLQGDGVITVVGGRFDFLGGELKGSVFAENAEIHVGDAVAVASELFVRGSTATLGELLSPVVALHLLSDFEYNATLKTLPGAVNRGRIVLDSSRGDRFARLDVSAGFTNGPGAVVETVVGGGGTREITGILVNQGRVTAAPGSVAKVTGEWEVAGGRNEGDVNLVDVAIRVTKSPVEPNAVLLFGSGNRLGSDVLANVILRLTPDAGANAALLVPASRTNHGVIELTSPRSDRSSSLEVADWATLENAEDGLIEIGRGAGGGREIRRTLVNRGQIHVQTGAALVHRNAGKTFIQGAGRIDAEGSYTLDGGRFEFRGGAIAGTFIGLNAEYVVEPTASAPSTVFVLGESSSLIGLRSPAVTLQLTTSADYNAVLKSTLGTVNDGRIVLGSPRGDRYARLDATAGLLNSPSGAIQVVRQGGGDRLMFGVVRNQGLVTAPDDWYLTVQGEFEIAGGRNEGPVNLLNTVVRVTASPAELNEVRLYGDAVRLATDNLPRVALRIISYFDYNSRLTITNGYVNRGILRLDSDRGDRTAYVASDTPAGTLANATGGRIEILAGAGGGRVLSGALSNDGVIDFGMAGAVSQAGATHRNRGTIQLGTASASFTGAALLNESAGIISGSGNLDVRNAPFTNAGTLAPGASPGRVTITGNYVQAVGAVVEAEIGGKVAGTQHDQVLVQSGAMTFNGGTLKVRPLNGFVPVLGDEVVLLQSSVAGSGNFAAYEGLAVTAGISWQPIVSATSLKLRAVAASNPAVAPVVVRHPSDVNAAVGGTATFNVTVTGTAPFTYQWYFNEEPIAGATQPSYTVSPVASTHQGAYRVKVTNAGGSVTSNPGLLAVAGEVVFRWDGGGDGANWTDPRNWNNDRLPVPGSRVVIDVAGSPSVRLSDAEVSIGSIECTERFEILGARLQLTTGASSFTGPFNAQGAGITIEGAGRTVSISGATVATGTSLEATGGARITWSGLTRYDAGILVGANYGWRTFGAGSVIDLPNLTELNGTEGAFAAQNIEALQGGQVLLPKVVELDGGFIRFNVDNAASRIVATALTRIRGHEINVTRGATWESPALSSLFEAGLNVGGGGNFPTTNLTSVDRCTIRAQEGAKLSFPGVTEVDGGETFWNCSLESRGTGSLLAFPNVTRFRGVRAAFASMSVTADLGGAIDLSQATDLGEVGTRFNISRGGSIDLFSLTAMNGLEYYLSDGGRLDAPGLVEIRGTVVQVGGPTSVFPSGGVVVLWRSSVAAQDGAVLGFPNVTRYDGGAVQGSFQLAARGAGAVLDLSNVTELLGVRAAFSTVTVIADLGGIVRLTKVRQLGEGNASFYGYRAGQFNLPVLESIYGYDFHLSGGARLEAPKLTELSGAYVEIADSSVFPTAGIRRMFRSSLLAIQGAQVSLPVLTAYDGGSVQGSFNLLARDAGSRLEFPALTRLDGVRAQFSVVELGAYAGGTVSIPLVSRFESGAVRLKAEGAASVASAPALVGVDAVSIEARNGGNVVLPALAELSRSELVFSSAGEVALPQLAVVRQSHVVADGSIVGLPALRDTAGSNLEVFRNGVFNLPPASDLQVTGIVAPAAALGGQPVSLSWVVKNASVNPVAGPRFDGFALRRAGSADIPLGTVEVDGTLAANAEQTHQATLILPPGLTGVWRVVVTVDAGGGFFEGANESNNVVVDDAPIGLSSPDLVVSRVTPAAAAVALGTPLKVAWVVKNQGTANAPATWEDQVLLSSSATDLSGAVEVGRAGSVRPLAPDASYTNELVVTPPLVTSLPAGSYFVVVRADVRDRQFEANEANNTAGTAVSLSWPPLPDLEVSGVAAPAVAAPGETVSIAFQVRNGGARSLSGTWSEAVWISSEASPGSSANPLARVERTVSLDPGTSLAGKIDVTVPVDFPPGSNWRFRVAVDVADEWLEVREDNNVAASPTPTTVPAGLSVFAPQSSIREDAQPPVVQVRVQRNGDLGQPLLVNLASAAPATLSVPASVVIAAGEVSASFPATVHPDGLVLPDGIVTLTASAGGLRSGTATVTVGNSDAPALTFRFNAATVAEGQVAAAVVSRNAFLDRPLTLTFATDSPGQLLPPATVTLPAGQANVTVMFPAVDDDLIEPLQVYSARVGAPGFPAAEATIGVVDDDLPVLEFTVSAVEVSEGAGTQAAVGTVRRSGSTRAPLRVLLESNRPDSVVVPASVMIPVGLESASFAVGAVDNASIDGPRTVELAASASYTATTAAAGQPVKRSLLVTDDDGPALTLVLDRHVVGEGLSPATSGTVRRNSPVGVALPVQLTSSDPGEAVPPAQVTIPAGAAEVRFEVATISDGVADGNQSVLIQASAAGHLPGRDSLVVTDVAKPDLVVAQVGAPANGLTRALATIRWQVRNQGLVEAKGKFRQLVYLSRDNRLDADDPVIAEQELDGQLPPDVSFSFARAVFLPAVPGDYWAIVRTDAGNAFDEVLEDNNVSVSASPIRVEAAYSVEVATDVTVGNSGEPVVMKGTAFKTGTRVPAPFEVVSVSVIHEGVRRVIGALTEADGTFVAVFRPGRTEAGFYEVAAAHPEVENPAVQDQFTLVGMVTDPATLQLSMVAGTALDGTFTLKNLGPAALAGLVGEFTGLPDAVVRSVTLPESLGPQEARTVSFRLQAPDTAAPGRYPGSLRLRSSNGASVTTPLELVIRSRVPQLEISPASIAVGMVRGRQSIVEMTVRNTGGVASGPLALGLPEVAWLGTATLMPVSSLEPGASTVVKLLLTPGPDLPLTQYTGELGVIAAGATARVPFSIRAVSEATGDLEVVTEDEYTYYAAGAPAVADAVVQLLDPFSSAGIREGRTDAAGRLLLTGVPEGTYLLRVTAPKHARREIRVDIAPGVQRSQRVLLPTESVAFNWTVTPTEIPDRYRFTIDSTFESNVPFPVLTSEPFIMPVVFPGEVTQTSITITNHGLIAAKKLQIRVRSTKRYLITPLFTEIGDLPAKSTITVPIFVQHQPGVDAAMLRRLDELGRHEPSATPAPAMVLTSGRQAPAHVLTGEERRRLEDRGILPASGTGAKSAGGRARLAGIPATLDAPGGGGGGDNDCETPELEFFYFVICGPDGTWHLVSIDLRPITLLKDLEGCIKAIAEGLEKGAAGIPGVICDCASSAATALGGTVPKDLECLCAFLSLDPAGIAKCICPKIPPGELGEGPGTGGGIWGFTGATFPSGDGRCSIIPLSAAGASGAGSRDQASPAGRNPAPKPIETQAGDGVCARVKLRLEQDLVLTRSAFRGTLELDNRLAGSISNLQFRIDFFDAQGAGANALFGVRPPVLRGITAVDGTGILGPNATGEVEYTLVPAVDAAPDGETPYAVGGELRYVSEGRQTVVTLQPVPIRVLPQPRILVDYFHQRDVFSDDPHTDVVEPSEPYSVAVLLRNVGKGAARQVSITSAQPKIVDNEKGLLVDFQVVGTEVYGADGIRQLSPALSADFGDLAAGGVKIGRWLLKSSLQGLFIDYAAKFEHLDGLGQRNLSLIDPDQVRIHELSHLVTDFRAGADLLPDFLVNADYRSDTNDLPDTLYLSTGGIEPVNVVREATAGGAPTAANLRVSLSAAMPQGWSYLRVPDPQGAAGARKFRLVGIRRVDGTAVPAANFWQTDRTFIGEGRRPIRENVVHLLDYNSPGQYTLVYEEATPTDTRAPESAVASLPPQTFDQFPLRWSGSDNSADALKFDIFVSVDGAPFTPWLRDTALTSALYPGERGHRYAFYSVAVDGAGNREPAPATPDASTSTSLVNTPPKLTPVATLQVDEGTALDFGISAVDSEVPAQSLTYSLAPGGPPGLNIDAATGRLTWQTGEGNGPSTNRVTVLVRDNGAPPMTDSTAFDIVVRELNRAPEVPAIANATVKEGALLTFIVAATDADLPSNTLTYSLAPGAPLGAAIHPKSGVFTWRPREFQGPATNTLAVLVTDDGVPALTTRREFTVIVRDALSDFRVTIGSTNAPAGTGQSVPVRLVSGTPVTRVDFVLDSPSSALTDLRLDPLAPEIDSVVMQPAGTGRYGVSLTVVPGSTLDGDIDLARLAFATGASGSEVAPLVPVSLVATGSDGVTLLRGAGVGGRVFVVKDRPLLGPDFGPRLTLHGIPGRTYRVERASEVEGAPDWLSVGDFKLTQQYIEIPSGGADGTRFLRAREIP